MKKGWIILIVFLVVLFALIFFIISNKEWLNKKLVDYHNSKIDYSCKINADCIADVTGTNCGGAKYGCVNKNSVKYDISNYNPIATCESMNVPPTNCACENNRCVGYFCSENNCLKQYCSYGENCSKDLSSII